MWREAHTRHRSLPFRSWMLDIFDDEKRASLVLMQQAKEEAHQIFKKTGRKVHWTKIRDGLPIEEEETIEWESPDW